MTHDLGRGQPPTEIGISADDPTYLNPQAVSELDVLTKRYADDLVAEAGRLEANLNSSSAQPEITSSMIRDADLLIRRGYTRPKKNPLMIAVQVSATVGAFLTGLLADVEQLRDPIMLIVFVVLLTVTITTTVVAILKD